MKKLFRTAILIFLSVSFCRVLNAAAPLERVVQLDAADNLATWTAHENAPSPQAGENGGVTFGCPFGGGATRAYWDRPINADLSTATCLELDVSCDQPDAISSLNLYLKSGNGWLVGRVHLSEPGRRRVIFPRSEFLAEASPVGWQRIEAVRLSAWRGQPKNVRLVVHNIAARLGGVVVVQGTTSVEGAGESKAAQRSARVVNDWLNQLGIGHDVTTDDNVATALKTARVAILPYNSHPPAREVRALTAFLQRGGKLMVFYGADPTLAQAMHFKLGAYARTETPGRWSSFSFTDPAAWNVPARIKQESSNILPALPADDSASVIAWWENNLGARTTSPAWVASSQGLWMAHVLRDEDLANKQRMLLGLLGRLDSDVWPQAAVQAYYRAGCMAGASSYAATRASLASTLSGTQLAEADQLYASLPALINGRRYVEAVEQSFALSRTLTTGYAAAQPAQRNEFRGVWNHDGLGWYPGDWPRTCSELAAGHINALFANMLWGGLAHYPSDVLPRSTTFRRQGDLMAAALKAAHANGLQFHAWAVCWNPGSAAPEEFLAKLKKAGRLQQTADGKIMPWLSPSHPENVEMLLSAYEEVVRRYPIDGLHLDYIRYSDRSVDYSPAAKAAFEKWRGGSVFGWPKSVQPGGMAAREFELFRSQTITAFVREVSQRVRKIRPEIKISAAVFAGYPECIASVGQDWAVWLKNGYVDFVCPMNYTADTALFLSRSATHLALPNATGRVYEGLGITASECQLRPDQAVEQIVGLRKLGATGFVFFDLSRPLHDEILPYLRLGVLRE